MARGNVVGVVSGRMLKYKHFELFVGYDEDSAHLSSMYKGAPGFADGVQVRRGVGALERAHGAAGDEPHERVLLPVDVQVGHRTRNEAYLGITGPSGTGVGLDQI